LITGGLHGILFFGGFGAGREGGGGAAGDGGAEDGRVLFVSSAVEDAGERDAAGGTVSGGAEEREDGGAEVVLDAATFVPAFEVPGGVGAAAGMGAAPAAETGVGAGCWGAADLAEAGAALARGLGEAVGRGLADGRAHASFMPEPIYPERARREGRDGEVFLRVRVCAEGRAVVAEVGSSSGWEDLDAAARRAVLQRWRFHPGGEERLYEVRVAFRLAARGR
jgi:TonB family protein